MVLGAAVVVVLLVGWIFIATSHKSAADAKTAALNDAVRITAPHLTQAGFRPLRGLNFGPSAYEVMDAQHSSVTIAVAEGRGEVDINRENGSWWVGCMRKGHFHPFSTTYPEVPPQEVVQAVVTAGGCSRLG